MRRIFEDVFADTVFWIALIVRADQHRTRAQAWSQCIEGRLITTDAILTEAANALARPDWRGHAVTLIDHVLASHDMEVKHVDAELWSRGWQLYCERQDKGWSLTDCIYFLVMDDKGLTLSLTADEHFRQAGYRALLLEDTTDE